MTGDSDLPAMSCACAEGFDDSGRRLPGRHDCGYIAARNKLIPPAIRAATAEVGRDSQTWGRVFLWHMDRLWREWRAAIRRANRERQA